jgi:hypothetical protein
MSEQQIGPMAQLINDELSHLPPAEIDINPVAYTRTLVPADTEQNADVKKADNSRARFPVEHLP